MEILKVTTLNKDGSVVFDGSLNKEQVSFILSVGINYLLSQGAQVFVEDQEAEDDEDDPLTFDEHTTKQ